MDISHICNPANQMVEGANGGQQAASLKKSEKQHYIEQ